jgi:GT2 family glycosyltransferase
MITKPKFKILLALLHQGYVRPELAQRVSLMEKDERVELTVLYTNKRPIESNRNFTVQEMLKGDYDFLLTIDHDTVPRNNPLDLAFLGKDVVGCAYPQWNQSDPNYPIYFVGMNKSKDGYREHKEKRGLQEVDAVGSGCLMMSRKVLQKVKEPFVRKWKGGFPIVGLDFYFCEKAKEAGFKVFCHYGYLCSHFKDIDLLEVLKFKNGK